MITTKGYNRLTGNIQFSEIIPTRYPRKGEKTRRVPIYEALQIADAFYSLYTIEAICKKIEKGNR